MSGPQRGFLHLSTTDDGKVIVALRADGGLTFAACLDSVEITDERKPKGLIHRFDMPCQPRPGVYVTASAVSGDVTCPECLAAPTQDDHSVLDCHGECIQHGGTKQWASMIINQRCPATNDGDRCRYSLGHRGRHQCANAESVVFL